MIVCPCLLKKKCPSTYLVVAKSKSTTIRHHALPGLHCSLLHAFLHEVWSSVVLLTLSDLANQVSEYIKCWLPCLRV